MNQYHKHNLREVVDEWLTAQTVDDSLDMYVSDSLIDDMVDAAWAVLKQARDTQEWLKREGHIRTTSPA